MTHHVYAHCWAGGRAEPIINWQFSGTRRACQRFIRGRGNHGFYFITTINDLSKVRRRYGT
jgi:hypothetical protein